MKKAAGRIKLFRGDQILIPGIESVFDMCNLMVNSEKKTKTSKRRPRRPKPVQLSLFALRGNSLTKG